MRFHFKDFIQFHGKASIKYIILPYLQYTFFKILQSPPSQVSFCAYEHGDTKKYTSIRILVRVQSIIKITFILPNKENLLSFRTKQNLNSVKNMFVLFQTARGLIDFLQQQCIYLSRRKYFQKPLLLQKHVCCEYDHNVISIMSYTTSVLRQITPDQIVKLDFQEALMLAGGLKDLDQQRLTEFSQKISLLREHVNYLKIKVAEDKKRRIIDFENQLLAELKAKHRQHLPSKAMKQSTSNGTSTDIREAQMEKIAERPQQKVEISKIEKHLQQEEKQLQQKIMFSPANQKPSFFKWILRSLISSSQTQKQHEDEEEMLIQEPQIYLHQESQEQKTTSTLSREYLTKKYRDYKSQQYRNSFQKRKEH